MGLEGEVIEVLVMVSQRDSHDGDLVPHLHGDISQSGHGLQGLLRAGASDSGGIQHIGQLVDLVYREVVQRVGFHGKVAERSRGRPLPSP